MRNNLTEAQKERLAKAVATNKQQRLDRIAHYELDPSKCKFCDKGLSYSQRHNKFCSKSCAASFNNEGTARNFVDGRYAAKACLHCQKQIAENKFCNSECRTEYIFDRRFAKFQDTGIATGSQSTIKKFLIRTNGHRCEVCDLKEWQGEPIPLVLDHINGKPSDNRLKNLRLICGNCNMLLPTFAGKNVGKGGGRPYRNERYLKGLSY